MLFVHYQVAHTERCFVALSAAGLEDPRLFVWPGKGLYMLFGSKPWPRKAGSSSFEDQLCEGPLALQQWLVLVEPSTQSSSADPWRQGIIRLQYTDDTQNIAADGLRREKNWNPFVYRNRLLFSQVGAEIGMNCTGLDVYAAG
jgi:hypothetical protein